MQKKPNESFIDQYSLSFSQKVTKDFFKEKDQITGQDILAVTPSKQINFFVLKILFERWQEEMKRLESPYFDFKDPEVRKELISFMNVLSKKISVRETDFESLLEDSVKQTLWLLVDPARFLEGEFGHRRDHILTEKAAKNFLKYTRVLKDQLSDLFTDNIDNPISHLLQKSIVYFEEMQWKETLGDELTLMSEVEPISLKELLAEQEVIVDKEEEDPFFSTDDLEDESESFHSPEVKPEPLPVSEEITEDESEDVEEDSFDQPEESETDLAEDSTDSSFDEEDSEEEMGEDGFEEEEDDDFIESETEEEVASQEEDDEEPTAEEEPEDEAEEEKPAPVKPLNERLAEESSKTVNDNFDKDEKVTIAEQMEQSKVSSIMQAISVNNKFMFVKELFDEEREVFEEAIEMIEGCSSFDDAVELLVQDYAKTYDWDMNSDVVKELLKVVFRKFR